MPQAQLQDNASDNISVYSLDYDGCMSIFNHFRFKAGDWQSYVGRIHVVSEIMNAALKDELGQILLINGSARQSARHDLYCRIHFFDAGFSDTGSVFYFLTEFEKYLKLMVKQKFVAEAEGEQYAAKIKLNPFLMPDLYDKLAHGSQYNLALNTVFFDRIASQKEELLSAYRALTGEIIGDQTKISLLYAQIHKVASENENKTIHFHFYDDTYEIISDLCFAYFYYEDLLPQNVILYLHRYPLDVYSYTEAPQKRFQIHGTGTCDKNYSENTLILRNLIQTKLCQHSLELTRVDLLRQALEHFNKKRKEDDLDVAAQDLRQTSPTTGAPALTRSKPSQKITAAMAFDTLSALKEMQARIPQNDYPKASDSLRIQTATDITLSLYKLSYQQKDLMFFGIHNIAMVQPVSEGLRQEDSGLQPMHRSLLV